MSAFLFRARPESIRAMSDAELEFRKAELETWLAKVPWSQLKQLTYQFDEAHGKKATLAMVNREIMLRKEGRGNEPLGTAPVPGYNP